MKSSLQLPPGPINNTLETFINLSKIIKNINYGIEFLKENVEKYGDIVTIFNVWNRAAFFLRSPELIREMLINQHQNLYQGESSRFLNLIIGNGLLTSNGKEHHLQRKSIQPEFHRKRIDSYFEDMKTETLKYISNWEKENTFNIHTEMKNLTLRIVSKTLFDFNLKESYNIFSKEDKIINNYIMKVSLQFTGRLKTILPFPSTLRFYKSRSKIKNIITKLIKQKKAKYNLDPNNLSSDLLTMLIHIHSGAKTFKEKKYAKSQVYDQAMTFFLAGHETTANALTWAWYLLLINPSKFEKLKEEVKNLLSDNELTLDNLNNFVYAKKVFKEALRLYPPAWFLLRRAINDFEINGYEIKKGFSIAASPYISHRDPRYFENPEEFIPERWTEEFEKNLPRGAYFPFGGGPRMCIGEAFANMEGVVVLVLLAQKFDFELTPANYETKINPQITLTPFNGVPVRISKINI